MYSLLPAAHLSSPHQTPDFKAWGGASARAHKDRVFAVGWSSDGKRLGSVSADKSLRIWPEKAVSWMYGASYRLIQTARQRQARRQDGDSDDRAQ